MRDGRAAPSDTSLSHVAFTGRLALLPRRRAEALVVARGGCVVHGVSRRTTLLVVGMGGWPVRSDGSVSRKLQRAEALRSEGAPIEIVSEPVFLERLGLAERAQDARKQYDRVQVSALLGIDERTLHRWEVMGLVTPSADDRFDFQDLVSLRTIAELISRGVKPHAIATSVRQLGSVLRNTARPLAQLKLVAESGEVLAELGGALLDAEGQWRLDFEAVPSGPAAALAMEIADESTGAGAPANAHAWFDRGTQLEEDGCFDEAEAAYRVALEGGSPFPEAHFNLGNVLCAAGRAEAAEEHYRLAASLDPAMAAAWYNLADLQEAAGRLDEAIASLRRAVEIDPAYADAHYNLALCCTAAGVTDEARHHWQLYLRLDANSPWAQTARGFLADLGTEAAW
jgi:tetratricopeptide (TPR) repeat protein